MKLTTSTIMSGLLMAGSLFFGCEGPEGPEGPEGAEGAAGPTGLNALIAAAVADSVSICLFKRCHSMH